MICQDCPAPTLPTPGALYCPEHHKVRLTKARKPNTADIAKDRYVTAALRSAGHPQPPFPVAEHDWTTGRPNVTCPACAGRYHYGAPVPCTHLCPLCETWVYWDLTGEIVTKQRRVRKCPRCGAGATLKSGKYGQFWGCDSYKATGCKGAAKDFSLEEYDGPELALVVWTPPTIDDTDDVAHFARLDRATQERKTEIEGRAERYKNRWWNAEKK